jgi:hypothetical protein
LIRALAGAPPVGRSSRGQQSRSSGFWLLASGEQVTSLDDPFACFLDLKETT